MPAVASAVPTHCPTTRATCSKPVECRRWMTFRLITSYFLQQNNDQLRFVGYQPSSVLNTVTPPKASPPVKVLLVKLAAAAQLIVGQRL